MRAFVEQQVGAKGYGNVSEYFRSLVRDAQQRETNAELERLLLAGLASGDDLEVTPQFWVELRAEAAERLRLRRDP